MPSSGRLVTLMSLNELVFLPVFALVLAIIGMWISDSDYFTLELSNPENARRRWLSLSSTMMWTLCLSGAVGGFEACLKLSEKMGWGFDWSIAMVMALIIAVVIKANWQANPAPQQSINPVKARQAGEVEVKAEESTSQKIFAPKPSRIWRSKNLTSRATSGIVQYILLTPAAYGLVLCGKAFTHINDRPAAQTELMKKFLLYKFCLDGFLTFLGITLAVGIIVMWAWIAVENAAKSAEAIQISAPQLPKLTSVSVEAEDLGGNRVTVVQKLDPLVISPLQVQPDYILMFGMASTALLVVLSMPAFLGLNASAMALRDFLVPATSPDMWKAWLETNKVYADATSASPVSFLTSGSLSVMAPFATAVLAYVLPKSKDK
jgi:hypothetical protein